MPYRFLKAVANALYSPVTRPSAHPWMVSGLKLPCSLLCFSPLASRVTPLSVCPWYLAQTHDGSGKLQVSPTFPPHWWNDRIGTIFRPRALILVKSVS